MFEPLFRFVLVPAAGVSPPETGNFHSILDAYAAVEP